MEEIEIIPESFQLIKMTDEEYFSSEYTEYISNSKLGLIDPNTGGSKEKYQEGFKGDRSDSFELGSAVHAMVLQPDFYTISDIKKPSGKLGFFVENVYENRQQGLSIRDSIDKASIDANYYSNKLTPVRLKTAIRSSLPFYLKRIHFEETIGKDTLFLSEAMSFKYEQCMIGVENNPEMMSTLCPQGLFAPAEVYNEYAILVDVNVTIDGKTKRLKLKAKLDNFTVNHETQEIVLNDLKTSGKPVGFFMGNYVKIINEEGEETMTWYDGSFQKFHYYRQMGMYLWLLSCLMQHKGLHYKTKANILVVETIPNFRSKVYSINGKQIKQGISEFKKLLILVANE